MTLDDDDSLVQAEIRLRKLISEHSPTPQELERQERAAQRLRERFSSTPYGKKRDEKDGMAYWRDLHASAILSN